MKSKPFTPRPYQKDIALHIVNNLRCSVWAGMGLGKTSSVLLALKWLAYTEKNVYPVLIIAPLRVARSTWPDEVSKWNDFKHLNVSPIIGGVEERRAALRTKADIYTINYENLPWLVETLGEAWPFHVVVADESTKLKGFRLRQGTRRAKALARVAHSKVSRFVNLTGTPSPNGLQDLWGQQWFVDTGNRLGKTFDGFSQRWFSKTFDGWGLKPLPYAQEQIQAKLSDVCVSLNAADYFDIREAIQHTVYVDLPVGARAQYRELERQMFVEIAGKEINAVNAGALTMKCLQLANGAVYVNPDSDEFVEVHDEKIKALEDIIEEAAGMPVLVAYQFRSDLSRLQRAIPKGRVLDASPAILRDWNAGKIPVLFAHPASAGHGLNLQDGGNILVFFGHNWNLEEYQQIIERIGPTRQAQSGYDRPVFIYHIVARDTVDEMVMERRQSKREVQDILLDAMKRKTREETNVR